MWDRRLVQLIPELVEVSAAFNASPSFRSINGSVLLFTSVLVSASSSFDKSETWNQSNIYSQLLFTSLPNYQVINSQIRKYKVLKYKVECIYKIECILGNWCNKKLAYCLWPNFTCTDNKQWNIHCCTEYFLTIYKCLVDIIWISFFDLVLMRWS
jgi:hypothetical protein